MSILDPANPRFIVGSDEDRRRARAEFLHAQRLERAMRSGLPEIPRAQLTFGRFGHVEDLGGEFYRVRRGEFDDPKHSSAVAYFVDEAGAPVYLEKPPNGPRNREEHEQAAAAREQRRADREAESRQRLARMKRLRGAHVQRTRRTAQPASHARRHDAANQARPRLEGAPAPRGAGVTGVTG